MPSNYDEFWTANKLERWMYPFESTPTRPLTLAWASDTFLAVQDAEDVPSTDELKAMTFTEFAYAMYAHNEKRKQMKGET